MDWLLFAVFLAAAVSTTWVCGLACATYRAKGIWERLLCVVLSAPGFLVMFITYQVLEVALMKGTGFIGGIEIGAPGVLRSPVLWTYLTTVGLLTLIVAIRRVRARGQGRA